jgi:two-component system response regulator HydG
MTPDEPLTAIDQLPRDPEILVYLTHLNGSQTGARYRLDEADEFRLGRGVDCQVMLSDPLSSRIHAYVRRIDDQWHVIDNKSRNGTLLNGVKIQTAPLNSGSVIRIGAVELLFEVLCEETAEPQGDDLQTLVRQFPLAATGPSETVQMALAGLRDAVQAQQLLLLYQLSIKLLGCDQPDDVIRIALDLLRDQTRASSAAFLWIDDTGHLKPKLQLPEGSPEQLKLSESLSALVIQQGNAVWINRQQAQRTGQHLAHFADALCIPLVSMKHVVGAMLAYMERGKFQQQDFDFAISLANIVAVALVRARQHVTLTQEYQRLSLEHANLEEIIGQSTPIQELKERMTRVARANGSVLIRGESGVGKELVARGVHRLGPRADRPLLTVNCAAIPSELMESQLFGHKAGAFTGADRDHQGFFQQADSGTLFLDEVGELSLEGQAKLLRILEGHPFQPVGSKKAVTVDVRVIAATNRDLLVDVRERKFREDLYYRLSVFELKIPAVRERGSDVALLLDYFLQHFKRLHGRNTLQLSAAARAKLLGYHWPGNVRQLRNVIDSAVVMTAGPLIESEDLGLHDQGASVELDTLRIDHWERKLIIEALKRAAGNVPESAKLLGLSRATLYRKLDEYQIERTRLPAEL